MSEGFKERIESLERVVFGDRDNPKDNPGIIADQMRMSLEQKRTNEILIDLRDSVRKINWLIIAGFVYGLVSLVFRGLAQ